MLCMFCMRKFWILCCEEVYNMQLHNAQDPAFKMGIRYHLWYIAVADCGECSLYVYVEKTLNSLIFAFNLLMELSQRVAGPQFTKRKLEIQVSCLQSTTESLRNRISKSKSCYIGRYGEWLVSTEQRLSFTGQRSPCLMLISREWQSHLLYHLFWNLLVIIYFNVLVGKTFWDLYFGRLPCVWSEYFSDEFCVIRESK